MNTSPDSADIGQLQHLIRRLRAPDGCPWDRRQTLLDLRAYLLEEAHEVAAAIDSGDSEELSSELGDLLFQVVFIAELGQEQGTFHLADVIERIHTKMIERHPHVFGEATKPEENSDGEDALSKIKQMTTAEDVQKAWEQRKLAQGPKDRTVLAGVPNSLPALVSAYRMTQKAAGVGFDWPDVDSVLDKVREELAECEEALNQVETNPDAIREEVGDLLFTVANLARHLQLDPEAALAQSNRKFRRRFGALEADLAERGRPLPEANLEELDEAWNRVKAAEKAG